MRTSPESGRSSPVTMDSVVVLPAPFGPTSPMKRPAGSVRSIPATAVCVPKRLVSPRICTAGTPSDAPSFDGAATVSPLFSVPFVTGPALRRPRRGRPAPVLLHDTDRD